MKRDAKKYITKFSDLSPGQVGKLLTNGVHHRVYMYGSDKVIKIPKKRFDFMYSDKHALQRDLDILNSLAPGLAVQSWIHESKDTKHHCLTQRYLPKFRYIKRSDIQKNVQQFEALFTANKRIMDTYNMSIDYLGGIGLRSCIQSILNPKVVPIFSNMVLEIKNGKEIVHLIDTELNRLSLNSASLSDVMIWILAYSSHVFNALFLKLFFNLDPSDVLRKENSNM